ncbi:MAG: helix-turn-helix transcriptional regulator [Candidatus Hydrothermales bacterium]
MKKIKDAYEVIKSLDELIDLARKFMKPEEVIKNLIIDGKENINIRLWVLREIKGLKEKEMAKILGISLKKYKRFERFNEKVDEELIYKISRKFKVKVKWLKCKSLDFFP